MKNPHKKIYIAVQIEENGKYYAYAVPVAMCENLVEKLNIKGLITANICDSRKDAAEIVTHWNACHKANGKYLFDETF